MHNRTEEFFSPFLFSLHVYHHLRAVSHLRTARV